MWSDFTLLATLWNRCYSALFNDKNLFFSRSYPLRGRAWVGRMMTPSSFDQHLHGTLRGSLCVAWMIKILKVRMNMSKCSAIKESRLFHALLQHSAFVWHSYIKPTVRRPKFCSFWRKSAAHTIGETTWQACPAAISPSSGQRRVCESIASMRYTLNLLLLVSWVIILCFTALLKPTERVFPG